VLGEIQDHLFESAIYDYDPRLKMAHLLEVSMRFSVVINTLNRAAALRHTLISLEHQTYPNFEVIVVNGPSTDNTVEVLGEFADAIRVCNCPEPRLAVSRNIGIAAAAGDVVAFIDDDSLATPTWLQDLAKAFQQPRVGAAGGLVYDPTGVELQYRFAACHRNGHPVFKVEPPLDKYVLPGSDPVAYLQGTNMAYLRSALVEIGGFDERIRHYFDDVDICLRVIDHGYCLRPLDGAAVHHKFLASHVRDHRRTTLDPYNLLVDRIHFGLKHGATRYPLLELYQAFVACAAYIRDEADHHLANGTMTQAQRDYAHRRIDEAMRDGMGRGVSIEGGIQILPDPRPEDFKPYPIRVPEGNRLRICFISREYPPGDFGGPGRYTHELAGGFAEAGHEVHVITRSPDIYRVDQEEGAWVHRLPTPDRVVPELDGAPAIQHLYDMASVYHEVCKIHASQPLDIVLSPLWLCEGLVCALDDRFATAATVITAMKAVSVLAEWAREPGPQQLVRLEEEYIRHAKSLHAISGAIRDRSVQDYGADPAKSFIAPLGLRDRSGKFQRRRPADAPLQILYAGRLETRKGVGEFLEMAAVLGREFSDIEFVLVGKDIHTDDGDTHRERFLKQYAGDPDLLGRVRFTGIATDDELYQHYADCDIFCLPTHYESFGLVFVEAMMWGKPLVGSRVGGVPEVVADGEQGYLCPVGDSHAVIEATRKLILDPDLRTRFGQRSRELYERKWELSRVISRMAEEFRGAVLHQRDLAKHAPTAPPPRNQVGELFAGVLERVAGITTDAARRAANRLLNPIHYPVDLVREIEKCWDAPIEPFMAGLYRVLLNRPIHPSEIRHWAEIVEKGIDRIGVLGMIVGSPEFRQRGECTVAELLTPTMLARPLFLPAAHPLPQVAPPPSTFRSRLLGNRYVGKFLRYAKSVIYLPWNFNKLFRSANEIQQVIRDTASLQGRVQGLLLDLSANQAALQTSVNHLAREVTQSSLPVASIVKALEDISDYLEPYSTGSEQPVFLPMSAELDRAA
jgi:glycogen synthase